MSAAQIKRAENKKALDALSELIKKCPDDTVLLFVVRGQAAAAVTKIFESREVEFKAPLHRRKRHMWPAWHASTGLIYLRI